ATVVPLHAQSLEQLAVGPPQIHRIEPPPASASARELEKVGDSLQTDKNYLDAIDYYWAAQAKDPHNAVLMDKDEAVFYNNRAASLFGKKEFAKASADYAKAIELDPDILERSERGGGAQARLPSPQDRAHYDYVLAKLYARNGMPERSLHYLRRAIEDGYRDIKNVYKDAEFSALRNDPRFAELMASKPASIPE